MAYKITKANLDPYKRPRFTQEQLENQGYSSEKASKHPALKKNVNVNYQDTGEVFIEVRDEDVPSVVLDGLRLASASLRAKPMVDASGTALTSTELAEIRAQDSSVKPLESVEVTDK